MKISAAAAAVGILFAGCAARDRSTDMPSRAGGARPPEPPALTEWHREAVISRAWGANIYFMNHADASICDDTIVGLLQLQYDWLRRYLGAGPRWIYCHTSGKYTLGFSIMAGAPGGAPWPEMFLQAGGIFDTESNYAHEMTHCFNSYFGNMPHWFNESMADVTYFDSEVYLYHRRRETEFIKAFDRVDHRSYELMQLRGRFGAEFFPNVYRIFARNLGECRRALGNDSDLETKNRFIVSAMSEAAGVDLLPMMEREFGFNVKTRERQRGY
ncbi:MAG: hypothetical protein HY286_04325 [Planctomycetes bacterium]|nr:hypothetical protein [Planctomycetota bacterium]